MTSMAPEIVEPGRHSGNQAAWLGPSAERQRLTEELREAALAGDLELHYQPVVELATGRIVGLEALSRWRHPVRGWIPPEVFIPLAEECGSVLPLDIGALTSACLAVVRLRRSGLLSPDVRLSVNCSARNLSHPLLVSRVRDAVCNSGLPLKVLDLEVTETAALSDFLTARRSLAALRDLGIGIALDDFGTGHSSLRWLRELPVTCLKIDRSFVQYINERAEDHAISASIVHLARALGKRTIVEGIETPEQRALFARLGCNEGQGHLWSEALPEDDLAKRLLEQPAGFGPDIRQADAIARVPEISLQASLHDLISERRCAPGAVRH